MENFSTDDADERANAKHLQHHPQNASPTKTNQHERACHKSDVNVVLVHGNGEESETIPMSESHDASEGNIDRREDEIPVDVLNPRARAHPFPSARPPP